MIDHAQVWRDALARAGHLDPIRIAAVIVGQQDNGLRAQRFDAQGGRTSFVACQDAEHCDDGPDDHSHLVHADPTGNAATRGRSVDPGADDLARLDRAAREFITAANGVLWWVSGDTASSWSGVVRLSARLMPGTVQAGLDVDEGNRLPRIIDKVDRAVSEVARIAAGYLPRTPSQDERHWTAGLAPEDCCRWHYDIKPVGRYKRPRAAGTNVCPECIQVAEWAGQKPPEWFMEALIEKDSKPKAYERALSRLADALEVPPHRRVG